MTLLKEILEGSVVITHNVLLHICQYDQVLFVFRWNISSRVHGTRTALWIKKIHD